jgi:GxxExxY protein
MGIKHTKTAEAVLGCAFEAINELGAGFLESVYERALLLALRQKGLSVVSQHPIRVEFRGQSVGDFYPFEAILPSRSRTRPASRLERVHLELRDR